MFGPLSRTLETVGFCNWKTRQSTVSTDEVLALIDRTLNERQLRSLTVSLRL